MRIDLHTHSSASDGTDTPAALVREAKAAGLDVVALTDHDATSGWAEAQQAAGEYHLAMDSLQAAAELESGHHLAWLEQARAFLCCGLLSARARLV